MMASNMPDPSAKIAELERRIAALEQLPVDIQVQNRSFTANEGQHCIVECPPAGLTVTLPRARPQNRNARITFTLRNSNPVRFIAVDGKVNSRSSGVMASPGTFDAISDGSTGWAISVLAAGPTAVPTLSADFVVGVANPGVPNARVATASVEITPSIAVANVISWALNASSVVFGKLQNLTGLSVLGRAANSAGVMAAITAGGAQQYLRSNAAGTSLEFADPASASIVNTGGQFVRAAITGDVTVAQALNVASFRSFASKSVLANASSIAGVPSDLAGSASFQHLRVNAANNALEWSVLTSGDFPANVVPLAGIATIASDTFLGNVSGGVTGPSAVNLSSLAGSGLGFTAHALRVNVGVSVPIVANTLVREALTGAITAAQDSNATAFGTLAAKSVLANATNAVAVPTAFAGTVANTYLRVNAANTALEYGALPAGVMPTIQPGSFLGLQITAAGAVAAIEITGAEAGQNIRFNTWATDTTSAGNLIDYPLALGVTGVSFQGTVNANLQGIALSTGGGAGNVMLFTTANTSRLTLEHESASELTAARRLRVPGSISATLLPNETAIAVDDTSVSRRRIVGFARARSAVQANGGTVSPAETLNHVNGTGTTATCPVVAGVAAPQVDVNFASQAIVDAGVNTIQALNASLFGLRPGCSIFSTLASVTNSVANNDSNQTTINANVMGVGSTWLAIGYLTVARGATNTASNLTVSGILAAASQTEASAGPLFVGLTTRAGGLVACMFTCLTTGAGGTGVMRIWGGGLWGASNALFSVMDLASSASVKAPFTVNTTINNNFGLRAVMSVAVPGLLTQWTQSGVIRII